MKQYVQLSWEEMTDEHRRLAGFSDDEIERIESGAPWSEAAYHYYIFLVDDDKFEYVNRDGGEPEDQTLSRDWSWVVPELNKALRDRRSGVDVDALRTATRKTIEFSRFIDEENAHRDPEANTWGRISKIAEEFGEAIQAYIGVTGQNPRKGPYGTNDDVLRELLDVAFTAIGAYEHLDWHSGRSIPSLLAHIDYVHDRVGLNAAT